MKKTSLTLALLSVLSSSAAAQDRFIFRATPGVLGVVGEPGQPQPEPPLDAVDTVAPRFTTTLPGDLWVVEAGTTESASIIAADDSGEVDYDVEAGPAWLSYEAGLLTAIPPRGATFNGSVSLKATDPSGNTASYSFQHRVGDTVSPTWYSSSEVRVEEGDTLQEAIRAEDAGGEVSINRVAGDSWIGFDAARNLISGSPSGIGTYTITLRAADPSGNYADHTISVIVEDTTPPAWASLPPGTISAQQNVELTFFLDDYISDRNGPYMLSYTKVAGPAWISVTPFAGMFVLSGTPTMTGAFEVVVEATDMYGNSSTATIPGTIHP